MSHCARNFQVSGSGSIFATISGKKQFILHPSFISPHLCVVMWRRTRTLFLSVRSFPIWPWCQDAACFVFVWYLGPECRDRAGHWPECDWESAVSLHWLRRTWAAHSLTPDSNCLQNCPHTASHNPPHTLHPFNRSVKKNTISNIALEYCRILRVSNSNSLLF